MGKLQELSAGAANLQQILGGSLATPCPKPGLAFAGQTGHHRKTFHGKFVTTGEAEKFNPLFNNCN